MERIEELKQLRDLNNPELKKIKIPEQVNYINPTVGHLIEQRTQNNEQSIVNPTRSFFQAIESTYSTDITRTSNPYYDINENLSK